MPVPAAVTRQLEPVEVRNRRPQRGLNLPKPSLADAPVGIRDPLQKVGSVGVVAPWRPAARVRTAGELPHHLRHEVQVPNRAEEPGQYPELLILTDLFEMGLSKALRILPIAPVRSFQDQLAIQAHAFAFHDRTVSVRMIAEVQLVRPLGAAVARSHVHGDSDARKLSGMQRTHLAHTTARRHRLVESRPGDVAQESERIQDIGLAGGVRTDEEGATAQSDLSLPTEVTPRLHFQPGYVPAAKVDPIRHGVTLPTGHAAGNRR